MDKIILAIESSCDETAISILKNSNEILSNIISSQISTHKNNGGVIPELASRLHLENIDYVLNEALLEANLKLSDIDVIAVVNGPGLVGALHVGVIFAKSLAFINNIPIIALHHIAGHIYANSLIEEFVFPLLALVVSGGHTELVLMNKHLDFNVLGTTRDDAIGEAYDKIARILGLGYPGGPLIDNLAKTGNDIFSFPIPKLESKYDFSYSGLKSSIINKVNQLKMKGIEINNCDISKSFQVSAITPLIDKSLLAIEEFNVRHFVLAGGVAANSYLRSEVTEKIGSKYPNIKITLPPLWACTDNSIMIAALASYYDVSNYEKDFSFSVEPNKKI